MLGSAERSVPEVGETTSAARFGARGLERRGRPASYLSRIAAWAFLATSGGIVVIPCACFACCEAFAITSLTSFPPATKLQPGIRSAHLSCFTRHLLWFIRADRQSVGLSTRCQRG